MDELLEDWKISLRARPLGEHDRVLTVGQSFAAYLIEHRGPSDVSLLRRAHVETYLALMRERGLSPATVAKHYRSLQQLFVWLVEEGELDLSPMHKMKRRRFPSSRPGQG